ncbi:GAF domain-containing sensor histidine kinase [Actinokineospora diospyrosa]|uniref:Histidine kinase-, DNA gyrase B-, and HSP90-like ATPase n=1 Tax=Actinokineospora diospyrosa TaxID=103728 RepID=A0ABT1IMV8_9PSEU|nr:GAF domain-containing sensor histidine kinase [Actinokineospora diospyrosa]MCP2274005.1 Histidine kinase-, DNA gyrase B-, and HSP90-like ATPase [Actinokineospora diospyrosa]
MTGIGSNELRAVSAAVLAVATHLSVHDVLRTILTCARRLVGARYAALGVPDDAGGFAEFLADGVTDEQWAAIGPVPRQHGLLGALLHDPNPVRIDDVRAHPRFEWWPKAHPVLTDFLGMPITDGDEVLGEIFVANKTADGGFTDQDEELLELLAAHAAIAIVNARLHERARELSIVQERTRIARELHDAVTQKLFSLRLAAESAAALARRDAARSADQLDLVRALAAEVSDELRAAVVGLRPPDLAGDGLDSAIGKQADLLNRVHGVDIVYRGGEIPRLTTTREEAVYRVLQEALHNALRHARAQRIRVDLRVHSGVVVLEVADDGVGFDVAGSRERKLGLTSMRDRARTAGGRLRVTSTSPGGTTVRLEVPVGG